MELDRVSWQASARQQSPYQGSRCFAFEPSSPASDCSRLFAPTQLCPISNIPHVVTMRQFTLSIVLGALLAAVSIQQVVAEDVENCWCDDPVDKVGGGFLLIAGFESTGDLGGSQCLKPLGDTEHASRVGTPGYCLGKTAHHLCCDKCREWSSCAVVRVRRCGHAC